MKQRGFAACIKLLAVVSILGTAGSKGLHAQSLTGHWEGSRSGRNPMNGTSFSVNFAFHFNSDGSYQEVASFGSWKILQVSGAYQLSRGRNPHDPTVTNLLQLQPQRPVVTPNERAKMLLESACVANADAMEQFVTLFNVAPMGGMSLKNTAGGDTRGINRVL